MIKKIDSSINMMLISFVLSLSCSTSLYAMKRNSEEAVLENNGPSLKRARQEISAKVKEKMIENYTLEVNRMSDRNIRTKCQPPLVEPIVCESAMVDNSKRVKDPNSWPHSVHGFIRVRFPRAGVYNGSGTLIGPGLVLTCAHVLCHYNKETKEMERASEVLFYPGRDQNNAPYEIKASSFYYPDDYNLFSLKEDYGLLVLEKDVTHKTGYFGLSIISGDQTEKKHLTVAAYPGNKNINGPEMQGHLMKKK